jgi:hypothetical protein
LPIGAKYLFTVSMDVAPEQEALFNEVYDQEFGERGLGTGGRSGSLAGRGSPVHDRSPSRARRGDLTFGLSAAGPAVAA